MENKELNIAAILKDKPKGTKLYSKISGICTLKGVYDELYPIQVTSCKGGGGWNLMENGKYENEGECLIFPSKQMRDWSKFAWKRGDVLVYIDDEELYYAIFEAFQDDEYTAFKSRYNFSGGNHWLQFNSGSLTNHFAKASNDEAKKFIKDIEEHYGGKLNLDTLEIEREPKQEFKIFDKVLVRDCDESVWFPKFFSYMETYEDECDYHTIDGMLFRNCIHYEGNEDMAFTTKPF